MSTEFKYKLFPQEDGIYSYYASFLEVSQLDLNSEVPLRKQWNDLSEEERWKELNYSLMVIGNLYGELEELKSRQIPTCGVAGLQ